jgi:AbrB family looped-hinge helix DNA binding protein
MVVPAFAKPVRLSSKGQIVIPLEVRRRLGLKTGDPLVIVAQDGEAILMTPRRYVESLRGAVRGTYGRTREEVDAFIRRERTAWRG